MHREQKVNGPSPLVRPKTGYLRFRACSIDDLPRAWATTFPARMRDAVSTTDRDQTRAGLAGARTTTYSRLRCAPDAWARGASVDDARKHRYDPGYLVAVVVCSAMPCDIVLVLESDEKTAAETSQPSDPPGRAGDVLFCPHWLELDRVLVVVTNSTQLGTEVSWTGSGIRHQFESVVAGLGGLNHVLTVDNDDTTLAMDAVWPWSPCLEPHLRVGTSVPEQHTPSAARFVLGVRSALVAWVTSAAYRPPTLRLDTQAYMPSVPRRGQTPLTHAQHLVRVAHASVSALARQRFSHFTLLVTCLTPHVARAFYWTQRLTHLVHALGPTFTGGTVLARVQLRLPRIHVSVLSQARTLAYARPTAANGPRGEPSAPWIALDVVQGWPYTTPYHRFRAGTTTREGAPAVQSWVESSITPWLDGASNVRFTARSACSTYHVFPDMCRDRWELYRTLRALAVRRSNTRLCLPQVTTVLPTFLEIYPKWFAPAATFAALAAFLHPCLACPAHSERLSVPADMVNVVDGWDMPAHPATTKTLIRSIHNQVGASPWALLRFKTGFDTSSSCRGAWKLAIAQNTAHLVTPLRRHRRPQIENQRGTILSPLACPLTPPAGANTDDSQDDSASTDTSEEDESMDSTDGGNDVASAECRPRTPGWVCTFEHVPVALPTRPGTESTTEKRVQSRTRVNKPLRVSLDDDSVSVDEDSYQPRWEHTLALFGTATADSSAHERAVTRARCEARIPTLPCRCGWAIEKCLTAPRGPFPDRTTADRPNASTCRPNASSVATLFTETSELRGRRAQNIDAPTSDSTIAFLFREAGVN
jgi:hypothetical protein